jgi:Dna[CI] antecedent, DciA
MPKKRTPSFAESSLSSIEAILPKVFQQLGLDTQVQKLAVLRLWEDLMPTHLKAPQTQAIKLVQHPNQGYVLTIATPTHLQAHELQLQQTRLLEKLNAHHQTTGIWVNRLQIRQRAIAQPPESTNAEGRREEGSL